MWRIDRARLNDRTLQWKIRGRDDGWLTFDQVAQAWRTDEAFREFWIARLRELPFEAFAWECPPVKTATASRDFECVFVSSPALARTRHDPDAFAEHFRSGAAVAIFDNLGSDAVLVAPAPQQAGGNFAHLAAFTATAASERQHALWVGVGRALAPRIGARSLWLSTAGLGVAWLHVRLDSRPKYYRHRPYTRA